MKKSIIKIGSLAMLVLGFLSSCVSDVNSPGLEYMPDMYRSPSVEAYVDHGEVRGAIDESKKIKLSAMTPPNGTIPYTGTDSTEIAYLLPYWRRPTSAFAETHGLFDWVKSKSTVLDYEYLESFKDKNPMKLNAVNADAIMKEGKEIYSSKCMHCHGEKGDGQGPMVTSGAYAGVPAYTDRATLGDGQIFYSIYYGKGMMGAHASLVNKKEIWTLVHYVRKFQDATYGTFDANGVSLSVAKVADPAVTPPNAGN